ncbi:glycosyltransferase family 4 protein [Paenibacillus sp. OV219]|uniref:glycosyltransferase family 4 protein n=1 Tax=Paenibacillus sp. OV219 TaxID=1884377 RepID=UPI0008B8392B|nr:glycosyltransferase family 4 protein [Paenibacillus sp. OV219]SEN61570.1 Glycosyltransferase involved in cell wall bisynthesis [Paenibacillus sp. OV219]
MRVLFITNIPAPYRVDFWNELGLHCDLTVWFEASSEKDREWEIDGLGKNFKYKFLNGYTFGLDKHLNLGIIGELRNSKFDIYIMGGYSTPTEMLAITWLKFNRIPFLLNSDGGFIKRGENPLLKNIKRFFISSAAAYLSSGKNCLKYLMYYGATEREVYEYPFSSVSFSPNDRMSLSPADKVEIRNNLQLREKVVLSIGRFISLKGFDTLIKSFELIDDNKTTLVLIGGGPERANYEALIKEYELTDKVVLIDFLQKNELIPYWNIADLFVFPTRNDVWGLVLNEAITFGLPIIATTGAGASFDLVEQNKNGFVVEVDDIQDIANKTRLLLNDEDLRKQFGSHSREISELFTVKEMVKKHLHIFDEFLSLQGE